MAISAWRLALQPGSLDGLPIFVDTARVGGLGRQVVIHGYAQRDDSYPEDMRAQHLTFSFDAYVIGDDYMKQRDAVERVLRKRGAIELVHPKRGRMMVICVDGNALEDVREGGMCGYALVFTPAGENQQPTGTVDTARQVEAASDAAASAWVDDFLSKYDTANAPEFVRESAMSDFSDALDAIEKQVRSVTPDIGQLGSFLSEVSGLSTQLAGIITSPVRTSDELMWQIGRLGMIALRPGDALDSLAKLFGFGDDYPSIEETTPYRKRQAGNRRAMTALVRGGAVIEAARASSVTTFESSNAAIAARTMLVVALDTEMLTALDAAHSALADLRVAVVRDLTTRAAQLKRITTITLPATIPAALLAYQLYGDAARGDEIVARNNIKHPLFVPGGRPLEVFDA